MVIYEILLISVGLSLDVFAYALYKGAMMPEVSKGSLVKMCGIFTAWQMTSLVVGNLITNIHILGIQFSADRAAGHWELLSILIFLGLGVYMIVKSRKKEIIVERKEERLELKQIMIWACITSVDAFLAGIGFGFFETDFVIMTVTVGIVTALNVILGVYTGYWLGCQAKNKILATGGWLLLIGGIELLIREIH